MASNPMPNPLPCGCLIADHYAEGFRQNYIRHCPMHEAAAELLKACDEFIAAMASGAASRKLSAALTACQGAIAKARPAKEKRAEENLDA